MYIVNNFIVIIVEKVDKMFFHIGKNRAIRENNIIGVFDMENTTVTAKSRIFLEKAQSRGEIEETDFELPKSYVVCSGKSNKGKKSEKGRRVYLSSLSPSTLVKKSLAAEE